MAKNSKQPTRSKTTQTVSAADPDLFDRARAVELLSTNPVVRRLVFWTGLSPALALVYCELMGLSTSGGA